LNGRRGGRVFRVGRQIDCFSEFREAFEYLEAAEIARILLVRSGPFQEHLEMLLPTRIDDNSVLHSLQSARLALRLFDVTASVHGLAAREREWLEYAALLHDIGYSIQYRGHHKHAYYLITNADLDAFDQREIEIIAHVARYHRGPTPKPERHPTLAALKPWQQRTVRKLAALLRLADALDRTHASRVDEIYGAIRKGRVTLEVLSRYEVDLELAAARQRGKFFAKVFDCRLRLRQGLEVAAG